MNYIKSIELNRNKNNINGIFKIDKCKIFYKVLTKKEYLYELDGYELISKYYKVPKKLFSFTFKNKGFVGYSYVESKKLLLEYFLENDHLNDEYFRLFDIYKKVFDETIKYKKIKNSSLLFEDRLNTRLKKNYIFLKKNNYENKIINYNGENIIISLKQIYEEVKKYFEDSSDKKVCIVSQCDPNDLNICMDGTMLDYTAGGYVPLMAEFATFYWYNFGQAEYLSMKYNKNVFEKYDKSKINIQKFADDIKYNPRKIRKEALNNYIDIIKNVMDNFEDDELNKNWFNDFKNYLAMKVLAVFDFIDMEKKDIDFSLAFISKIYNMNFEHVEDLKKIYNMR